MGLFDIAKRMAVEKLTEVVTEVTSQVPFIQNETNKKQVYDLNSLEGITAIQVPKYEPLRGIASPVDNIEYILQRKATEHKKNNRMDLAIACLKKSNELMPFSNFNYSEKDYLRLVKYLKLNNQTELANQEERKIYMEHPEFRDKRISNSIRVRENLIKQREWNNDLVLITTNNTCCICKKYNNKIYSLSGKNKQYEKIPSEIVNSGGFCPKCYLGIHSYFKGINSKPNRF